MPPFFNLVTPVFSPKATEVCTIRHKLSLRHTRDPSLYLDAVCYFSPLLTKYFLCLQIHSVMLTLTLILHLSFNKVLFLFACSRFHSSQNNAVNVGVAYVFVPTHSHWRDRWRCFQYRIHLFVEKGIFCTHPFSSFGSAILVFRLLWLVWVFNVDVSCMGYALSLSLSLSLSLRSLFLATDVYALGQEGGEMGEGREGLKW